MNTMLLLSQDPLSSNSCTSMSYHSTITPETLSECTAHTEDGGGWNPNGVLTKKIDINTKKKRFNFKKKKASPATSGHG